MSVKWMSAYTTSSLWREIFLSDWFLELLSLETKDEQFRKCRTGLTGYLCIGTVLCSVFYFSQSCK